MNNRNNRNIDLDDISMEPFFNFIERIIDIYERIIKIYSYGICVKCFKICYSKRFQQNFKNWTSGNNDIDKLIQNIQLSTHKSLSRAIEWIPYDRFYDIEYIAKGGFGIVHKANWIDGPIEECDDENNNWKRSLQNKCVALKSLNNSANVSLEFMNEVFLIYYST
jgi:hypothetical protein